LAILISNAASNRYLRRFDEEHRKWSEYKDRALFTGENNVQYLDAQIAVRESEGWDTFPLREARRTKVGGAAAADRKLDWIGATSRDFSNAQVVRNSRIYDFADLPHGTTSLNCLSNEFWDLFSKFHAANTASRDLELQLLELEQRYAERFEQVDEYSRRAMRRLQDAVAESVDSSPELGDGDDPEALIGHLSALENESARKENLLESLRRAQGEQLSLEGALNRLANNLFIQCKLLHAEPSGNNIAQGSQNLAENPAEDSSKEATDEEDEEDNEALSSSEESSGGSGPEMISKSGPVNASEEANGESLSARKVHTSTEEDAQTPLCDRHQNAGLLTSDALLEISARVRESRKRLKLCKRQFKVMRACVPPEAMLLDRKMQGPMRVSHMQQKTRELIDAEVEYRNILREAQNAHVMVNEPSQCSNFCDRDDETFTNGFSGLPQPEVRREDVQQWLDAITGNDQSASTPDLQHDLKMDWDSARASNTPRSAESSSCSIVNSKCEKCCVKTDHG
jgi:hypothetical protein